MRTLVVFFLCAFTVRAQAPVWVEKPVPHWSCAKGFFLLRGKVVACERVTPNFIFNHGYDPQMYEEIHWEFTKVVPRNGKIEIKMPPGFYGIPGCDIWEETNVKSPVIVTTPTEAGFSLKADPGHHLRFDCRGLMLR